MKIWKKLLNVEKWGLADEKRRKPHEKLFFISKFVTNDLVTNLFFIPKFVTNDLVTNLGTYKN